MHSVEKDGKLVSDLFHYKTEYGHHSHNISDFFYCLISFKKFIYFNWRLITL